MPHYYASIPALDHKVFKYAGYVHPLNEDHHRRMFETYGAIGQPSQGGEPGPFRVLLFDEYKGDRITEDGERYGEQPYTSKQIILTKRIDNQIVRMMWIHQSSPREETTARAYARDNGWFMHCVPVNADTAWDTCIERHVEIEADQKKLGLSI